MLNSAWDQEVNPSVISNCFRHFGFFSAVLCRPEPIEYNEKIVESEINSLSLEFSSHFLDSNFEIFVKIDKKLSTYNNLEEVLPTSSNLELLNTTEVESEDDEVEQEIELEKK
ncbi:unnamed protein product [Brachionus calyciflorus]|uniref:Uncharacterized protein n=1 Tax=Brachionus calyciflorus TaxID=104777 RepID=A0A814R4R8_9BILA|nr:unnamed protein product [Brachionus calyciflorus]